MQSIPTGFHQLETTSPFIVHVGPLYIRSGEECIDLGLLIEEKHCNRSGNLHGAMVSAVADIALGQNVAFALLHNGAFDNIKDRESGRSPIATVSMSTDYTGTARIGDWVQTSVEVQRAGRSLAFANAYLIREGERIARTSGIYKVVLK